MASTLNRDGGVRRLTIPGRTLVKTVWGAPVDDPNGIYAGGTVSYSVWLDDFKEGVLEAQYYTTGSGDSYHNIHVTARIEGIVPHFDKKLYEMYSPDFGYRTKQEAIRKLRAELRRAADKYIDHLEQRK